MSAMGRKDTFAALKRQIGNHTGIQFVGVR